MFFIARIWNKKGNWLLSYVCCYINSLQLVSITFWYFNIPDENEIIDRSINEQFEFHFSTLLEVPIVYQFVHVSIYSFAISNRKIKEHYQLNRFQFHVNPKWTGTFARYTESRDIYRKAIRSGKLTDVLGINCLLLLLQAPHFSRFVFYLAPFRSASWSWTGSFFSGPFHTDWSISFLTPWKSFSPTANFADSIITFELVAPFTEIKGNRYKSWLEPPQKLITKNKCKIKTTAEKKSFVLRKYTYW